MTNPTTPFSWQMPTASDLVTDLPADFETFGQAVATSMADLLGGTTGQVLSKASNTDMDFTWVTSDDANAIQNTIVDAKGDLIGATAADTPARLAVGNNGENLVADSSASTGLRWQGNYSAGKNAIINGDFNVWQRGTSFSPTNASFTADRWSNVFDGSGATRTVSRQTFTAGNTIPGYEFDYFYRFAQSVAGTGGTYNLFQNRMEDVRTFAGQTVTISFWGKAAASTNLVKLNFEQEFGTGGSPSAGVSTDLSTGTITLTTSWQRFSYTVTVPSISGKTVGTTTSGFLGLRIWCPVNSTFTLDFVGFQVELGSTATSFQTATGTIQGELAACQRYYVRYSASNTYSIFASSGFAVSSTFGAGTFTFPVEMRTTPSAIDSSTLAFSKWDNTHYALTSPVLDGPTLTTKNAYVYGTISGATAGNVGYFGANNSTSAFIGFTAEL
jgi:predicted secreted protein